MNNSSLASYIEVESVTNIISHFLCNYLLQMNPESRKLTTIHLNTGPAEQLAKVNDRPIITKEYTVINVTATLDL